MNCGGFGKLVIIVINGNFEWDEVKLVVGNVGDEEFMARTTGSINTVVSIHLKTKKM